MKHLRTKQIFVFVLTMFAVSAALRKLKNFGLFIGRSKSNVTIFNAPMNAHCYFGCTFPDFILLECRCRKIIFEIRTIFKNTGASDKQKIKHRLNYLVLIKNYFIRAFHCLMIK